MLSRSASMTYSSVKSRMRTHPRPSAAPVRNGRTASSTARARYTNHTARRSCLHCCQRWLKDVMRVSGALDHALAEKTRRPDDQHQDQYEKGEDVLVMAAEKSAGQRSDVTGAQTLDHTEQQAAQHRPGDVADAAQHRGGESLEPEHEAHVVMRQSVISAEHDARHRRQRGTNHEGN